MVYKTVSNLQRHVDTIHREKKKYKCELCKYKSSQKVNVTKHFDAVHLKLRPYQCGECTFKCSRSNNLKTHINDIHRKTKDKLRIHNLKCKKLENN